jgi:hypothetical protein
MTAGAAAKTKSQSVQTEATAQPVIVEPATSEPAAANNGFDREALWASMVIATGQGHIVQQQGFHGDARGPVARFLSPYKGRIRNINVDKNGVGAYFVAPLAELGYPAMGVNVGESSSDPERFANRKAEYYWGLRELFEGGHLGGLVDEATLSQLASIRYRIRPRGQIEIESKEELRRRGVKSPDRAEALMLCFAQAGAAGMLEFYRQDLERMRGQVELTGRPCANPGCRQRLGQSAFTSRGLDYCSLKCMQESNWR